MHRVHTEDPPEQAAAAYEEALQLCFDGDAHAGGPPPIGFDLILLGIGTDGHTASLFPGDAAVQERTRWVTAFYRQNEQLCRITLTPTVINAARCVAFLVSGADKADIMGRVVRGAQQPQRLPAQIIQPTRGEVYWLVDAPAATGSE